MNTMSKLIHPLTRFIIAFAEAQARSRLFESKFFSYFE